jgi:hypothetical protein
MNSEQAKCERAYQRGKGTFQVRTNRGRLVADGQHIENVEGDFFGTRTLWRRAGASYWMARVQS